LSLNLCGDYSCQQLEEAVGYLVDPVPVDTGADEERKQLEIGEAFRAEGQNSLPGPLGVGTAQRVVNFVKVIHTLH